MSATAPSLIDGTSPVATTDDQTRTTWQDRIRQARAARKPYEPTWRSNLAFAAGQHWLVYDRVSDNLRHVQDVGKVPVERDLLTDDRISEYRDTQLGELEADDERPQLLVAQESETAEDVAEQLNRDVEHAWNNEWLVDRALAEIYATLIDLGTAAARLKRDPTKGDVVDKYVPHDPAGKPVTPETHPQDWQALQQTGAMADGTAPQFKPVREGATCIDTYTPFGILAPPGVHREWKFPWFVLVSPVHVDDIQQTYGITVKADSDIASAMGLTTSQTVVDTRSQGAGNSSSRLKEHAWLYTCFEEPCAKYPNGRVTVLASNDHVVCDQHDYDYQRADKTPHSGVVFFHWRRLNDRFYSRAWIEALKDPQRALNNDVTLTDEIIARGGPKVITEEPLPETPNGAPMENVVIGKQKNPPIFHQGMGLPPALVQRREALLDNLAHAATISDIKLGINPANADTYSALALLNENEAGKRSYIRRDHKRSIGLLVELGVHDIKKYWSDGKKIMVSGDDDQITLATYRESDIPVFFQVKQAKGAPQPRSQAAELKKIDAFWAAAAQSGLVASDPGAWVDWYTESVEAGSAQKIPEPQTDSQQQTAHYENLLMQHGEQPVPADYDLLPAHLPIHREAQDQARAKGDDALFLRIQTHIDQSMVVQQENAAKVAGQASAPSPLAPGQGQGQAPVFVRPDFLHLAQGN